MDHRIASARPLGRALTATMAAAGLLAALLVVPSAHAQQPPKEQPKAAPKAAPKQAPAAKPAEQPPQQQAATPALPPLMYTSWVKLCQKGPETENKQVCVVHKDGRMENGMPVVMAELLQVEGANEKLRVYVPLSITVHLAEGTRVLLDQTPMGTSPYVTCLQIGCFSEYEANADTVAKLKKGQNLIVQAYIMNNTVISLPLPLNDFAKAYDGPPTDPKVLEEQQRKLQEALQKKAAEAQEKLKAQQPAAPAPK